MDDERSARNKLEDLKKLQLAAEMKLVQPLKNQQRENKQRSMQQPQSTRIKTPLWEKEEKGKKKSS